MTQLRTGLRWSLGMLVAVGLLGMPGAAWSQGMAGPRGEVSSDAATPRVAGTAVEFVLTLPAFAGEPVNASNASSLQIFGSQRFCDDTCVLNAAVSLPSGAVIIGAELDAFDMDAAGRVRVRLLRCARGSRVCEQVLAVGDTGDAATPGVVQIRFDLSSPHTVDNGANAYLVEMLLTGGTSNTSIGQVRIFYQLQVSPAPAVATFSDVPTSHPFFQFIEALARSGITSGCGGGNFCPDAPLTRGQMAVFLSLGLGLHFAP